MQVAFRYLKLPQTRSVLNPQAGLLSGIQLSHLGKAPSSAVRSRLPLETA